MLVFLVTLMAVTLEQVRTSWTPKIEGDIDIYSKA